MKDMLSTVGQHLDEMLPRDAIHIAGQVVQAKEMLKPGEWVSFDGTTTGTLVGVVDPFRTEAIQHGEYFWLFVTPCTITGLRHHWEHPEDIKLQEKKKEASKQWITEYANSIGMDYDWLMREAKDVVNGGYGINTGTLMLDGNPDSEFWDHFEIVTDIKVSHETREQGYFTCSC